MSSGGCGCCGIHSSPSGAERVGACRPRWCGPSRRARSTVGRASPLSQISDLCSWTGALPVGARSTSYAGLRHLTWCRVRRRREGSAVPSSLVWKVALSYRMAVPAGAYSGTSCARNPGRNNKQTAEIGRPRYCAKCKVGGGVAVLGVVAVVSALCIGRLTPPALSRGSRGGGCEGRQRRPESPG